jgi:hypothetical protein
LFTANDTNRAGVCPPCFKYSLHIISIEPEKIAPIDQPPATPPCKDNFGIVERDEERMRSRLWQADFFLW